MSTTVTTQLMFYKRAKEAMELYTSTFKNSKIDDITYYAEGEPGEKGTVKRASFHIENRHFTCIDSPIKHAFDFTPSFSIFVDFTDEAEFMAVFNQLSVDGHTLMPMDNYGFSSKFVWFNDRFGVSWQLSLA